MLDEGSAESGIVREQRGIYFQHTQREKGRQRKYGVPGEQTGV